MGSRASRSDRAAGRALAAVPSETWAAYLVRQRWFGAKARRIARVGLRDQAALPGRGLWLALLQVEYTEGPAETYALPLATAGDASAEVAAVGEGRDRLVLHDALADAGAAALVELIAGERSVAAAQGEFRFRKTEELARLLPGPVTSVRPIVAEQSNTSVVVDGVAILKVFRRLEWGLNPDFEIPDFLTRLTRFRGVPVLAGSAEYRGGDGRPATVGTLQAFVPDAVDGWRYTLAHLGEFFHAVAEKGGADDPGAAVRQAAADYLAEARALGRLTAELHLALASRPDVPAFAPEPITSTEVREWVAGMQAHLEHVAAVVRERLTAYPEEVQASVRTFLADADRFRRALGGLQALDGAGVVKTRHHGDYHLGQVLKTRDGFVILDFEGEPAYPLEVRRAKQCPLRDVGGMLRSFDYAAHAGLDAFSAAEQPAPDLVARLEAAAEVWEAAVRDAFLEAYLDTAREGGAAFLPPGRVTVHKVIAVYELDKAIYEVFYEIQNRPRWLSIPLAGLRRAGVPPDGPQTGR